MLKLPIYLTFLFWTFYRAYSQKTSNYLTFSGTESYVSDICVTDDWQLMAATDFDIIKIFSTSSKELLTEFKGGHTSRITSIDFNNDASILISGGRDSLVVIWDIQSEKVLKSYSQNSIVSKVRISPDGRHAISGGFDSKVLVFDIGSGKSLFEFISYKRPITDIEFLNGGKYFVTTGGDGLLNFYDLEKGTMISSIKAHKNWIRDIEVSLDEKTLLSCGDNSNVKQWDISNLGEIVFLEKLKFGRGWILGVEASKDQKLLAIGKNSGEVIIKSYFRDYVINLKVPISELILYHKDDRHINFFIATWGKGVIYIEAKDMKLKEY